MKRYFRYDSRGVHIGQGVTDKQSLPDGTTDKAPPSPAHRFDEKKNEWLIPGSKSDKPKAENLEPKAESKPQKRARSKKSKD